MKFTVLLAALASTAGSGLAGVVTYTSATDFQAASSIANAENFESFAQGFLGNPFTSSGIRFTQLPGGNANVVPYISNPGQLGNLFEPTSKTLDGNGDENFRIELANGSSFTAIGFDVVTNRFGAPVVSLYDASSALIGAYTLTQGPNTLGFFGAVSATPIASVTFIVDRGWVENTALDNVQIGTVADTPEPSVYGTMTLGLLALASLRRRQTRAE